MKKIFLTLIFLLIANHSFAETVLDYEQINKLDQHYKCQDFEDKSEKMEIGFKEVNGKMFSFLTHQNQAFAFSSVRTYKSKVVGDRDSVSNIFAYPSNEGLAVAVFSRDFHYDGELALILSWIKDGNKINWAEEHYNLFQDTKNIDERLINFSEKALDLLFTKLEFGDPFEPDDIWGEIGNTSNEIGNLIMVCK
tara:strand:- start:69 stop:650 length:582 start_codon:yes stop_codon:yes gene_type:complete